MTGVGIVLGWFAIGWLGWLNGALWHRRRYGEPCSEWLFLTFIGGPLNLVTFAMYGWNLRKGPSA